MWELSWYSQWWNVHDNFSVHFTTEYQTSSRKTWDSNLSPRLYISSTTALISLASWDSKLSPSVWIPARQYSATIQSWDKNWFPNIFQYLCTWLVLQTNKFIRGINLCNYANFGWFAEIYYQKINTGLVFIVDVNRRKYRNTYDNLVQWLYTQAWVSAQQWF